MKTARKIFKANLTTTKEDKHQKSECKMCQKNHDLDSCFKYKRLEVDNRKRFLMKSKVCFGCYYVISKEYNGNCSKRKKCSI